MSEEQPRVPAGSPDGGEWTSGGGGEKMFNASNDPNAPVPKAPFYTASTEEYARNFGPNVNEIHVAPSKVLDLTHVDAHADDGAQQLKSALEHSGVSTEGIRFGRGEELAESLNRNLPEISKRIHDAGFDAARLNEYVEGGGSDTTMLIVSDAAVKHTKRVE